MFYVFLAEDAYIDNNMWEHLKTKKETLFVKDLMFYIVGENLNEYALKPKKAGNLDSGIECKQLPESIKNIVLSETLFLMVYIEYTIVSFASILPVRIH